MQNICFFAIFQVVLNFWSGLLMGTKMGLDENCSVHYWSWVLRRWLSFPAPFNNPSLSSFSPSLHPSISSYPWDREDYEICIMWREACGPTMSRQEIPLLLTRTHSTFLGALQSHWPDILWSFWFLHINEVSCLISPFLWWSGGRWRTENSWRENHQQQLQVNWKLFRTENRSLTGEYWRWAHMQNQYKHMEVGVTAIICNYCY